MLAHVFTLRHDGQVVWIVVSFVAVDVMNNLSGQKGAPKLLLSDHPMFVAT